MLPGFIMRFKKKGKDGILPGIPVARYQIQNNLLRERFNALLHSTHWNTY